jgi:hypothetical protein
MRTPDVSRLKDGGSGSPQHICKVCGGSFLHRGRGGNLYCLNGCNWSSDENARQAIHRLESHREPDEATFTKDSAILPQPVDLASTPNKRVSQTWDELASLDARLSQGGPNIAPLRKTVAGNAMSIYRRLRLKDTSDERRQFIRAVELLRDCGAGSGESLAPARSYAWLAVRYYLRVRDYLPLARALQSFANICRILGDKCTWHQMIRYSYHILKERRQIPWAKKAVLLHQAMYWDLRACAERGESRSIHDRRLHELMDVTSEIDTPVVWLQTWQELSGYWRMMGDIEKAQNAVAELEACKRCQNLPALGGPSLLRAKIEPYFDSHAPQAKDAIVHVLETEYLPAYERDPRRLYFKNLKRWETQLGLSLQIRPPTYESPGLFYNPRGEL